MSRLRRGQARGLSPPDGVRDTPRADEVLDQIATTRQSSSALSRNSRHLGDTL